MSKEFNKPEPGEPLTSGTFADNVERFGGTPDFVARLRRQEPPEKIGRIRTIFRALKTAVQRPK